MLECGVMESFFTVDFLMFSLSHYTYILCENTVLILSCVLSVFENLPVAPVMCYDKH